MIPLFLAETQELLEKGKKLVELLKATAEGNLSSVSIEKDSRYATTIVAVSGGYPNNYEKGFEISGLDIKMKDAYIFHMGTKEVDGKVITNGGRVLCATALSNDLDEAINMSRDLIEEIQFEEKYFRRDIGFEFIPPTLKGEFDEKP